MRAANLLPLLAFALASGCGPGHFADWPSFGDDDLIADASDSDTGESSSSESSSSESSSSESSSSESNSGESGESETGCLAGGFGCACIDGACFGDLICAEGICESGQIVCGDSIALRDARIARCPSKPWVESDHFGNDEDLRAEAFVYADSLFFGRILLEFDLASIPADPLVVVLIELWPYDGTQSLAHAHDGSPTNAAMLLPVLDAWNEGQANWHNAPALGEPYFELPPLDTPDAGFSIDITQIVLDMRETGDFGHGFAIQLLDETADTRLAFASDESLDELLRPRLTYCFVTP